MRKSYRVYYRGVIAVLVSIFCAISVKSETTEMEQGKYNIVCKQKVMWQLKMCPAGKLVCFKNKQYVDKAKHYIKALGSGNSYRRVKASYKLMKIAPYILPYLKEEYKRVKNIQQKDALAVYRVLSILENVDMKIMCEDGEGGFMWYAVISNEKCVESVGYCGFILVGNEKGVIGGIQVRAGTDKWNIFNYSCDLRDRSRTKFGIKITYNRPNSIADYFVITDNWYYKNSDLRRNFSKDFYIIVSRKNNDKWVVIIDGKESKEYYKEVGNLVLSSSRRRYGFVAQKSNGSWIVIIDGKESKEYTEYIKIADLVFNHSGEKYGFFAQKPDGKWVAVVDGKESKEYDVVWNLVFNSSGERYGFIAQKNNGKIVAVIDGKESEEYYAVRDLVFSSSGKKYIFIAQKANGKEIVVVNGQESKEYKGVWGLKVSDSGENYGFIAKKDNDKRIAVINGKEGEEYSRMGDIVFSLSGEKYGFFAQKPDGKWVAVVDGKESKEYDEIKSGGIISGGRWSSNNKFFVFVGMKIRGVLEVPVCEVVVNGNPIKSQNCPVDFYLYENTLKFIEFRNNKIYGTTCKLK